MKKVEERTFWEVYYNPTLNIFEVYWKKTVRETGEVEMEEEEFKEYLLNFLKLLPQYGVDGFITDTREYHYLMGIDLQEWHDQVIAPQYLANNLKKIIFIMKKEFLVTSLSIKQAFSEENSNNLQVLYTEGWEEARSVFMKNDENKPTKPYLFYEAKG